VRVEEAKSDSLTIRLGVAGACRVFHSSGSEWGGSLGYAHHGRVTDDPSERRLDPEEPCANDGSRTPVNGYKICAHLVVAFCSSAPCHVSW